MMSGSCKRDAVQYSSAVPPRARLEVEVLGEARPSLGMIGSSDEDALGLALVRLHRDISFSYRFLEILSRRDRKPFISAIDVYCTRQRSTAIMKTTIFYPPTSQTFASLLLIHQTLS